MYEKAASVQLLLLKSAGFLGGNTKNWGVAQDFCTVLYSVTTTADSVDSAAYKHTNTNSGNVSKLAYQLNSSS